MASDTHTQILFTVYNKALRQKQSEVGLLTVDFCWIWIVKLILFYVSLSDSKCVSTSEVIYDIITVTDNKLLLIDISQQSVGCIGLVRYCIYGHFLLAL